jgi:hypothetical protein
MVSEKDGYKISIGLVATSTLFVSLVYCAESIVRWFVVREKHCWMTVDSADKSKRTGRSERRGAFFFCSPLT